jgi:hypothetical protein
MLHLGLPVVGAASPNLLLAGLFLVTWIWPTAAGDHMVSYCLLLMLLEFIVVHSSAFMGSVVVGKADSAGRVKAVLGLGLFYSLFVLGFALAFKSWWPLLSFWGLTLNRLLGVIFGVAPTGREKEFMQRGWGIAVLFYVGFAFVTTFLPMPRLGLTPDVVSAQNLRGSGLWISEPWRVIAFGFLYFLASGVSELFAHRWLPQSAAADAPIPERRAA